MGDRPPGGAGWDGDEKKRWVRSAEKKWNGDGNWMSGQRKIQGLGLELNDEKF